MLRNLLNGICIVVLFVLVLPGAMVPRDALAQDAQADTYVEGIPDLPLMPGLTAVPESGLVFDKPAGRIVQAFAEGSMTMQSVIAFYDETLPQLGWQRDGAGAYLREGERLKLGLSQDARGVTVQFQLFPQ
jgi:hypothetical protein